MDNILATFTVFFVVFFTLLWPIGWCMDWVMQKLKYERPRLDSLLQVVLSDAIALTVVYGVLWVLGVIPYSIPYVVVAGFIAGGMTQSVCKYWLQTRATHREQ